MCFQKHFDIIINTHFVFLELAGRGSLQANFMPLALATVMAYCTSLKKSQQGDLKHERSGLGFCS